MAITFEGSGAVTSQTAANPAVALPAGILANDICLWHSHSKDNTTHTYPADWSKVAQLNQGTALTHSWAWKRMAGGESGNVTVTIAGTVLKQSKISLWRGVRTTGDPHEVTANAQDTTATVDPAAVTITDIGDMIVALIAVGDDNVLDPMSGGSNVGTVTEQYEHTTITGTDGNIVLNSASPTATGSVDLGSDAMAASDPWIAFTIGLFPSLGTTFLKTLAATEIAVAAALKLISHLFPTTISSGVAVFATSFQTAKTLLVTELSLLTLSSALVIQKVLSALSGSAVALLQVTTFLRTLASTEVSIAEMLKTVSHFLSVVQSTGVVTIATSFQTAKTLLVTGVSSTTLSMSLTIQRALSAVSGSLSTLLQAITFARSLVSVGSTVATLLSPATFSRVLAATEVGLGLLSTVSSFFRTLEASVVGVTTLTRGIGQRLSATMVSLFGRLYKQAIPDLYRGKRTIIAGE